MDPTQFNLCIWNLEGFEAPSNYSLSDKEDDLASMMYNRLSTCDMFVFPGINEDTERESIKQKMENHHFDDFDWWPKTINSTSTAISRIDPQNITVVDGTMKYPINESKCGFTGSGTADIDAFSMLIQFHDPVPVSYVISARFELNSTSKSKEELCAIREAQAAIICDFVEPLKDAHVYVAGGFETDLDNLDHVFAKCSLTNVMNLAIGKEKYTREIATGKVVWDNVYVNEKLRTAKYLDQLEFIHDDDVDKLHLDDTPSSIQLYVHQPLTSRWKRFEIIWSCGMGLFASLFFVFLMIYSKEKPETNPYKAIEE